MVGSFSHHWTCARKILKSFYKPIADSTSQKRSIAPFWREPTTNRKCRKSTLHVKRKKKRPKRVCRDAQAHTHTHSTQVSRGQHWSVARRINWNIFHMILRLCAGPRRSCRPFVGWHSVRPCIATKGASATERQTEKTNRFYNRSLAKWRVRRKQGTHATHYNCNPRSRRCDEWMECGVAARCIIIITHISHKWIRMWS